MKKIVNNKKVINKKSTNILPPNINLGKSPKINLPPVIRVNPIIETLPQVTYNFEAFVQITSKGKKSSPISSITISKTSLFSLNSFFTKELQKIGEFTHVKLFYDRASNSIGIAFKSHKNEGCLCKLITSKVSIAKRFSSRAFFIYYGLDLTKISSRYEPKKVYISQEIGDVWVINLNKHA